MSPQQPTPSPFSMLVPFIGMFVIFYLMVFRPQSQARKQHEQMLKNLRKHDEVVTSGGIFGTILNVKDDRLTLRSYAAAYRILCGRKSGPGRSSLRKPARNTPSYPSWAAL